MLVVNASNTEKIIDWMNKHNNLNLKITNITKNRGLLALQGPKALSLLQNFQIYLNQNNTKKVKKSILVLMQII